VFIGSLRVISYKPVVDGGGMQWLVRDAHDIYL